MTELTIQLPEPLAAQLEAYLQKHPNETVVDLLQSSLQSRFEPKDTSKLLELAGIVDTAPRGAAEHAEDFED
jgi:hypothetical protein